MGSYSTKKVHNFIDSFNVMTLSTVDPVEFETRATPVFFARMLNSFLFVSFEETKHAKNILENPMICASITADYQNYSQIRGAQIFGKCVKLSDPVKITAAALVYFWKFPDVKAVFDSEALKHVISVSWYLLKAGKIIFTDNTVKFGHREEYIFDF
ncbi:MAG TPA: pyridoxamine 5'-phosphate oxidase family protein [Candidatus Wallbacteria bacterium]|nr:pyridoxamine 5'-phosphate oxidase family protein [Candidatus Wallbacteria bacterium]